MTIPEMVNSAVPHTDPSVAQAVAASDSPKWWSGYTAFLYVNERGVAENDATIKAFIAASDDPLFWADKIHTSIIDKAAMR